VGQQKTPGKTEEAKTATGAVNSAWPGRRLIGPPHPHLRRHYGWQIEIFFRFLKHILGCRHLLSTSPAGVEIQAYCAIIACLLIALWTGKKPTKRTYEMICFYFIGWADEEELLAHLEKLKAQDA
jgi:hypothetical protein